MNEIERIKKEGWLSADFWKPRTICDFQVSEDRIELWAILLDLYRKLAQVCEKHGLKFFAISGTALGAARHSGFIPWDDDMDFVMPREDYNKLISLKSEFNDQYALTYPSDELFNGFSFMRLHNSNTLGTSRAFKNLNINHGISIDIFPLDYIDKDNCQSIQDSIKKLVVENANLMKEICSNTDKAADIAPVIKRNFSEIEKLSCVDNNRNCDYVALRNCFFVPLEKQIWRKEVFSDHILMDFEGLKMRMPVLWEEDLRVEYGDWKALPPVSERGQWHYNIIYNAKVDYKRAIEQNLY